MGRAEDVRTEARRRYQVGTGAGWVHGWMSTV